MSNLYLIRGLPGSGKSTFAETLVNSVGGVWFEADHYFIEGGVYKFDPAKLHTAHLWCRRQTEEAMGFARNIVVSNTFTTEKELMPYILLAGVYGYKVTTLVVENRHGNDSVHNVPEETMVKMKQRFSIKL